MAQQTTVEWLLATLEQNSIIDLDSVDTDTYYTIINEAKQMENERVELRYKDGSPIRKYNSPKLQAIEDEISDEEILKAAKECVYEDLDISVGSFELGAKWYREQLKNK